MENQEKREPQRSHAISCFTLLYIGLSVTRSEPEVLDDGTLLARAYKQYKLM